jgi:hypothetical protein
MSRYVAPGAALGVVWYLLLLLAPWDTSAPTQEEHFFSGAHVLSGLHARLGIVSALVALSLLAALAAYARHRFAMAVLRPLALLLVALTTAHLIQAARVAPGSYAVGIAAWAAIALSVLVATATLALGRPAPS